TPFLSGSSRIERRASNLSVPSDITRELKLRSSFMEMLNEYSLDPSSSWTFTDLTDGISDVRSDAMSDITPLGLLSFRVSSFNRARTADRLDASDLRDFDSNLSLALRADCGLISKKRMEERRSLRAYRWGNSDVAIVDKAVLEASAAGILTGRPRFVAPVSPAGPSCLMLNATTLEFESISMSIKAFFL